MLREGRKRRGKLTVLQGVLQHSHYEDEELSKKSSEVFLSRYLKKIKQIFISYYGDEELSNVLMSACFSWDVPSLEVLPG